MKRLCVLACTLITLLSLSAKAGVPSVISFQGRLTDPSGNPVPDSSYSVQFVIWDSPIPFSGIPWWVENQTVTTTDGFFSVLLGSNNPLHYSTFQESIRYLGINVGPGLEMTPRTPLTSVPYAFKVATIDRALGGWIFGNVEFDDQFIFYTSGYQFIHKSGDNNTFLGLRAGNFFLSGSGNTVTGADALVNITNGNGNTANGYDALYNTSTGSYNTAVGSYAMLQNTFGAYNTAIGTSSLLSNFDGVHNTAGGYQALYTNNTGDSNTAFGVEALYQNLSGSNNAAFGVQSLYSNSTGASNAALGNGAMYTNLSGAQNTALGTASLFYNDGNYNTATGAVAMLNNLSGTYNTANGYFALGVNSSGDHNSAFGAEALQGNLFGTYNTAIGAGANVSISNLGNATAIGAGALVDASNKVRIGNASVSVIEGQVAFTFTSDKNLKENFRLVDAEEVLRKVRDLEVSSWNYIGQNLDEHRHYGPVAQDFFAAFGHDGVGTVGSPTTINSGDMAGIMMIAIQQLGHNYDAIKAENATLRSELDLLKSQVAELLASQKMQDGTTYGAK